METQNTTSQDKTIGIVSYLGPIGWIIALIMYNSKENKTAFDTFHLRQSLGASAFLIAGYIAVAVISAILATIIPLLALLGGLLMLVIWVIAVIFFIMGIINAASGTQKYLPMIGQKFEDMFKGFIK